MYKRKLVLFVVSFVMSMPAMAYYSAHELALDCSQYILLRANKLPNMSADDGMRVGRCMGFTQGFFETHTFVTQMVHLDKIQYGKIQPDSVSLFTLPEDATNDSKIESFQDHLMWLNKNNKQFLDMPASMVVLKFLMEKYPNPNQSSGG